MNDNLLIGKRLKIAMKHLHLNQTQLGKVLGVGQAEVSNKINGAEVSIIQAKALENAYGIRSEWLLLGIEPMQHTDQLKDLTISYESGRFTRSGIARRFDEQLDWYESQHKMLKGELAEQMNVPASHISAIRSGKKDISLTVLMAAMKLGLDLNYTLGGYGTIKRISLPESQVNIQKQLDEMNAKLSALSGEARQTG